MLIASVLIIFIVNNNGINKTTGFITYQMYERYNIIKTEEFETFVQISNSSGWNMETNRLNFGKLPPGGSSARFITLKNDYTKKFRQEFLIIIFF